MKVAMARGGSIPNSPEENVNKGRSIRIKCSNPACKNMIEWCHTRQAPSHPVYCQESCYLVTKRKKVVEDVSK